MYWAEPSCIEENYIKDPNYGACLIQSPLLSPDENLAGPFYKAKKLSNEKSSFKANFRHTLTMIDLAGALEKNMSIFMLRH